MLPTIGLTLMAHVPCCLPTLLLAIGGAAASGAASGLAWVHVLDPFRPYLTAFSFVTLAVAFWAAYRPVDSCACPVHSNPDHVLERRIKIGTVWAIAVAVLALTFFVRHVEPSEPKNGGSSASQPQTGRL